MAGLTLRAVAVIGVSLWLCRRMDQWLADPGWRGLAKSVQDLMAAHDRLAETVDRRLRSLEESSARAEAEVRFMATLLSEPEGPRAPQRAPGARAPRVERPPSTTARRMLRSTNDGVEGTIEGATA